jgi:hypothetical protein
MSTQSNTENAAAGGVEVPYIPVGLPVKNEQDAIDVLRRAVSDVDKMMEQRASFKNEKIFSGVQVSSSAVVGPTPMFAKRGIRLVYAPIPVRETAEKFYDFLITSEGYQLIDPNSDPKDFGVPVKGCGPWELMSGGYSIPKFQVEYAHMNLHLPSERDYVVLNGFDDGNKTFYSMSVQAATDEIPGSSIYEAEGVANDGPKGRVRTAFFSALRVEKDQKNPDCSILHYFQVSSCSHR